MNMNFELLAPYLFDYNYTVPEWKQSVIATWVKKHYLGDDPIATWTYFSILEMISDRLFVGSSVQAALLQARSGKGPIRFMKFSYRGKHSYTEEESGTKTVYGEYE